MVEENFPHCTTNLKHYQDQGSDTSPVRNFCTPSSPVILGLNQWRRHKMLAVFSGCFTLEWTCSKRPLQLVIHMVQNRHAEKQDNTLGQDKQMARIIVFKMVTFFLCLVQVHPSLAFQQSSFVPWYLTILVTDGHSGVIGSAGSYLPVYKQEGNWVELMRKEVITMSHPQE